MIDFLCIGAQKAGTSWLMSMLRCHPAVWTPRFVKELHYFDVVHLGYSRKWVLEVYARKSAALASKSPRVRRYYELLLDPGFSFTDAWYAHVFSAARRGEVKGECTPLYCALDEEGIRHVRKLAPKVKLIYMVRDPFERILSSYRMSMDRKKTANGRDLESLLDDPLFLMRGDYKCNIPRWDAVFESDRILYLPFGDIKSDPAGLMARVETHLGIPSFAGYRDLHESVHPTRKEGKVISPELLERMRGIADPQVVFLKERFGPRFVERIR
jgi:hypothetical protein